MNKNLKALVLTLGILTSTAIGSVASAQVFPTINYSVKSGDSLWKICSIYHVGVSEVIAANPQISDPNMIYVKQIVKVPNLAEVKIIEKQVLTMVNTERAKAGLAPLKLNWQLSRVARYKSQDMIDKGYFSHQSPTYGSPFVMMKNFGIRYTAAGENIAYGQRTAKEVMTGWMNSAGHRANI
jgi:uncharacterized YkwD family protein